MRDLTDAELDEANGGFILIGLLGCGFAAGFLGGCIAATMCIPGTSGAISTDEAPASQKSRQDPTAAFFASGPALS